MANYPNQAKKLGAVLERTILLDEALNSLIEELDATEDVIRDTDVTPAVEDIGKATPDDIPGEPLTNDADKPRQESKFAEPVDGVKLPDDKAVDGTGKNHYVDGTGEETDMALKEDGEVVPTEPDANAVTVNAASTPEGEPAPSVDEVEPAPVAEPADAETAMSDLETIGAEIDAAIGAEIDAAIGNADTVAEVVDAVNDTSVADAIADAEASMDGITDPTEENMEEAIKEYTQNCMKYISICESVSRLEAMNKRADGKAGMLKAKVDQLKADMSANIAKAAASKDRMAKESVLQKNERLKEKIASLEEKLARIKSARVGAAAMNESEEDTLPKAGQGTEVASTGGEGADVSKSVEAANTPNDGTPVVSGDETIEKLKDETSDARVDIEESVAYCLGNFMYLAEASGEKDSKKDKIAECKNKIKFMQAGYKNAKNPKAKEKLLAKVNQLKAKLASLMGKDKAAALQEAIEEVEILSLDDNSVEEVATEVATDVSGATAADVASSEDAAQVNDATQVIKDNSGSTEGIDVKSENDVDADSVDTINEALDILSEGVSQISDKKMDKIKKNMSATKALLKELRERKKTEENAKKKAKLDIAIKKQLSKLEQIKDLLRQAFSAKRTVSVSESEEIALKDGDSKALEAVGVIIDKVADVAGEDFEQGNGAKAMVDPGDTEAELNPAELADKAIESVPDEMSVEAERQEKIDLSNELVEASLSNLFGILQNRNLSEDDEEDGDDKDDKKDKDDNKKDKDESDEKDKDKDEDKDSDKDDEKDSDKEDEDSDEDDDDDESDDDDDEDKKDEEAEKEALEESWDDIASETLLEAVIGVDKDGKKVRSPLKFLVKFLPESQLDKILNVAKDLDNGKYAPAGKDKKEKITLVRALIDRNRDEKKKAQAEEKARAAIAKAQKDSQKEIAQDKAAKVKTVNESADFTNMNEELITTVIGVLGMGAVLAAAISCVPHIVNIVGDVVARSAENVAKAGRAVGKAFESEKKKEAKASAAKSANARKELEAVFAEGSEDGLYRRILTEDVALVSTQPVPVNEGYATLTDLLALQEGYFEAPTVSVQSPEAKETKLIQEMALLCARDAGDKAYDRYLKAYNQCAVLRESIEAQYMPEARIKAGSIIKAKKRK